MWQLFFIHAFLSLHLVICQEVHYYAASSTSSMMLKNRVFIDWDHKDCPSIDTKIEEIN